jgi:hypothetical protein
MPVVNEKSWVSADVGEAIPRNIPPAAIKAKNRRRKEDVTHVGKYWLRPIIADRRIPRPKNVVNRFITVTFSCGVRSLLLAENRKN